MKRFIVSVLCVAVFFIGLGALAENVGARFKSDEKGLALIKQARLALGGEPAIAEIRSMVIKGSTTNMFTLPDGASRTEQGEAEIALQLPDKLMKQIRIGNPATAGEAVKQKRVEVFAITNEGDQKVVVDGLEGEPASGKIRIKRLEGADELKIVEGAEGEFKTEDGKKVIVRKVEKGGAEGEEKDVLIRRAEAAHGDAPRQNELLRLTLALLLTAPEGMDVSYTFAGESDVDGTPVNIVDASFGGSTVKLYLSKISSLPVMISYTGHKIPRFFHFKTDAPSNGEEQKDKVFFVRKVPGDVESAEYQIRFSDYRVVNGVQLPYKWATSTAGQTEEVMDVTSYELNPANIGERFKEQRVFVRTRKEGK